MFFLTLKIKTIISIIIVYVSSLAAVVKQLSLFLVFIVHATKLRPGERRELGLYPYLLIETTFRKTL